MVQWPVWVDPFTGLEQLQFKGKCQPVRKGLRSTQIDTLSARQQEDERELVADEQGDRRAAGQESQEHLGYTSEVEADAALAGDTSGRAGSEPRRKAHGVLPDGGEEQREREMRRAEEESRRHETIVQKDSLRQGGRREHDSGL